MLMLWVADGSTVVRGDEMVAVPETTNAGPELAADKPAFASLTADERAELVWGDEANGVQASRPAPAVDVGQWAPCNEYLWTKP